MTRALDETLQSPSLGPKSLAPLYWGLVATTALVALMVVSIFWVSARNQSDNDWVTHTLALRDQLANVLTLVQRAESAQRGYLLTGRDAYLTPFGVAVQQLPAAVDHTAELIGDSPAQLQTFSRVRNLITDKVNELRSTIVERKVGHADAALAIVNNDTGLHFMQGIRDSLGTMQADTSGSLVFNDLKIFQRERGVWPMACTKVLRKAVK